MKNISFAALIKAAQNMRDAQKQYFRAVNKKSSDKIQILQQAKAKELEFEETLQGFTETNERYNIEQYLGGDGDFSQFVQLCRELIELQGAAFDELKIQNYKAPIVGKCREAEKTFDAKLEAAHNDLNPVAKQGDLFG